MAPQGAVGRAVSAVSHILFDRDASIGVVQLMWVMIGLEALYMHGKEGLAQQLYEKGQVVLGAIREHNKTFRNLYSYRSRFVHGGIDIPLSYSPYDAVLRYEQVRDEAYATEIAATAFLLATLQKMIQMGVHNLDFDWKLREIPQVSK